MSPVKPGSSKNIFLITFICFVHGMFFFVLFMPPFFFFLMRRHRKHSGRILFSFLFFKITPCGMQDLSSLTMD